MPENKTKSKFAPQMKKKRNEDSLVYYMRKSVHKKLFIKKELGI